MENNDRMPAARGIKPSKNESLPMVKQESLGGDSIKSNKIKKISFLKSDNQVQMHTPVILERRTEGDENPAPLP